MHCFRPFERNCSLTWTGHRNLSEVGIERYDFSLTP